MHTVSFFSFKGGVGRTNLLLNVAYGLALDGSFVVIADWDLQAPGLTVMERLGQPTPEGGEGKGHPGGPDLRRGVLDYLDAILQPETEIPDPMTMARPTRLGREVPGRQPAFRKPGDIWFIPAGKFESGDPNHRYHQQLLRVQGRNLAGWRCRFEEQGDVDDPLEVLKYFRSRVDLVEHDSLAKSPDYLLIDSRTGMTEIGDLLISAELADRMVLVTGLNEQNLAGLETVLRDLQPHIPPGELPGRLTLVVSPVPQGEEELKRERLSRLDALLERLGRDVGPGEKEFMPKLRQLPYHPRIALSEDLMLQHFPLSDPAVAMRQIVGEIQEKRHVVAPGAELRAAALEAAALPPEPAPAGERPKIEHHPWSRMPVWNWPDPAVEVEDFLPNVAAYPTLLNGLARAISLTKEDKERILKVVAEGKLSEFQLSELQKSLREEHRKFNDLDRRHWKRLLAVSVQHFGIWLDLWCKRGYGEKEEVLRGLLAGERDEFLGVWGETGHFWYCLTEPLEAQDLFELAEAAYRKAIEIDPEFAPPWNDLGNLLKDHLERYDEAEAAYRKAIELDPGLAQPWNNLAGLLQQHLERYDEAEAACHKAIELDPKSASPCDWLGNVLTQHLERYDEAEAAYRKAIELDPKSAHPWYGLANLLQDHLKRYEEAEAAYRKAIELDPKSAAPWNGLGNVLMQHLERYDEAEVAYCKAIELDPKSVAPWNGLGNVLMQRLERYDEAEVAYRKAIEIDPKAAQPWYGLGSLYVRVKRHSEARKAHAKAMDLAPEDPEYINAAAELALVEGDVERAGKVLEKAEALLKEDEERRNHLMLELALVLSRGDASGVGEAHEALTKLNTLLEAPSTWRYEDLEPCIARLPEAASNLLRQWIQAVKHAAGAGPEAAYQAYAAGGSDI